MAVTTSDAFYLTISNNRDGEIDSAVLMIHGEKAHSCYMSQDAFKLLNGDNKELLIIPDTVHTDLYDGGGKDAIPFDKIESFLSEYLK